MHRFCFISKKSALERNSKYQKIRFVVLKNEYVYKNVA